MPDVDVIWWDPGVKYPEPSIGRVLTAAPVRGTGMGCELLRRAIVVCHQAFPGRGIPTSAQHRLERFYVDACFVTVGERYLENELPYIEMLRSPL